MPTSSEAVTGEYKPVYVPEQVKRTDQINNSNLFFVSRIIIDWKEKSRIQVQKKFNKILKKFQMFNRHPLKGTRRI